MRPWLAPSIRPFLVPLAALALLAFSARPSHAAFAHGMECASVGSAIVSSCPDESCLQVSNIGSSGQDGVSISLYRSSGHGVSHSLVWDAVADLGAQITFDWTQVDGPTVFHHTCTATRTSSGVTMSGSLIATGGTLYLYSGDLLVSSSVLVVGGSLEVSGMSSLAAVPSVSIDTDGRRDLVACMISFPALVTIGGVSCDRAILQCESFSVDGKLTICHMTVTNPPGGTLGSITLSSQSLYRSGHAMTSLGQMHFSEPVAFSGGYGFARCNIGSSGQDGVSLSESPLSIVMSSSSGPGGGGGGGCGGGQCSSWSSSRPSMMSFSPGTLVFTPGTDVGASLRCDVTGSSTCSPDGVLASLTTLCRSTDLLLSSSFSSICADAESVHVSLNGVIVSSSAITLGGSVSVTPVVGGPLGMAINEKGLPGGSGKPKTKPKQVTYDENGDPVSLVSVTDELSLRVQFASQCRIDVNGAIIVGDGVTFTGHRLSGGSPTVVVSGTDFRFSQSSTGTQVPSTVDIQDVSSSGGDQVSALSPPTGGLSTTTTTKYIPVVLDRTFTSPARGYSVTLQLSGNLVLSSSVVEYDYLGTGSTQMFVTDLGSNRYVVDCAVLGDPCTATGSGTLFTLPVSAAPGATDGTGVVSIEAVELRSCDNDPLPCDVGSSAYVVIDRTAPSPASAVTATQVTTGNPPGATTAIVISYTLADASGDPVSVELYRAPYGNYPEYDDAPGAGAVPAAPAVYPPGAPWSLVNAPGSGVGTPCFSATGQCLADHPSSRDFYYYAVYAVDQFGNPSFSGMTTGTLNYHLGDNSDGATTCVGDNLVNTADISALGSSYGATLSSGSPLSCLDVGPTTNHRVSGRPMTDNKLNFEDLIISAINFSRVSAPADGPQPVASTTNSLRLLPVTFPAAGETFEAVLAMTAAGDLQGLSAQLDYDPAQLELLSVSAGELVGRQDRGGVVLSGGGGVIDAALLGEGSGFAGEGELARVRFRVRAEGEPRLALAEVEGRDVQNQPVSIALLSSPAPPVARTAIRHAYPNPFDRETRVEFTLAQRGAVRVGVYDVAGRHVRTLMDGVQDAGMLTAAWDGHDAHGVRREAGVYMIRIERSGTRETRTVRMVR